MTVRPRSEALPGETLRGKETPMRNFDDAQFVTKRNTSSPNRRAFLKGAAASAAALALRPLIAPLAQAAEVPTASSAASASAAVPLAVVRRTIEVLGRAATVYGIQQSDGTAGIRLREGDAFNVVLHNAISEPTSVHWHGLTPPWPSDGMPGAPLPPIAPNASRAFDFPVGTPGTYWMHAHSLQEQQLLAAPLIVAEKDADRRDEQEVVIMLHDFSFKSPEDILAGLTKGRRTGEAASNQHSGSSTNHGAMPGMPMGEHDMSGMNMAGMDRSDSTHGAMKDMAMGSTAAPDLNDFDYDAYLANDRTLDDPEIVQVERGGRVRLRIVNAAAATAFTIDLGALEGTLIAVDGQAVQPVAGRRFPLTMAQRVDLLLRLPSSPGAFPILALREGARERTGIVLRTPGASLSKLASTGAASGPVLGLRLESRLRARTALPQRQADKTFHMALTGDMAAYRWGLETHPRLTVDRGNRVEVTLRNRTMMAHPMHLHGHHFQVVAIDGRRFPGAVRDTVLVPPQRAVTIAVDADNVGQWPFHCHHLYHMETGMMTTFAYNV
jgi:FtsP/CotA-like multicopper oxidase with cupredoxin domain